MKERGTDRQSASHVLTNKRMRIMIFINLNV